MGVRGTGSGTPLPPRSKTARARNGNATTTTAGSLAAPPGATTTRAASLIVNWSVTTAAVTSRPPSYTPSLQSTRAGGDLSSRAVRVRRHRLPHDPPSVPRHQVVVPDPPSGAPPQPRLVTLPRSRTSLAGYLRVQSRAASLGNAVMIETVTTATSAVTATPATTVAIALSQPARKGSSPRRSTKAGRILRPVYVSAAIVASAAIPRGSPSVVRTDQAGRKGATTGRTDGRASVRPRP